MRQVAVCFDCDSTLTTLEGLDELARGADAAAEVAALTAEAMAGSVPLADALAQRMAIVRPSASDLERLGRLYAAHPVSGAAEAIAQLRSAGCSIRIASSGLQQAIVPFAAQLGVAQEEIHAVAVKLDAYGNYAGYDEDCALARADGKADICRRLAEKEGFRKVVMVGDGSTDAAAVSGGAVFVQFAGVCDRPQAARAAAHRLAGPGLEDLPGLVERIASA